MFISPVFKNNSVNLVQNHLPFKCKECECDCDTFTLNDSDEGKIDHDHDIRRINEKYASTRAVLARMLENGDIKSVAEYKQEMDKINKKEQSEVLKAFIK